MLNSLRRLIPQSQTHLLLGRLLPTTSAPFQVDGVRMNSVDRPGAPGADALESFASEIGFPAGWSADMLGEKAVALLAVDSTDAPLAMGWSISQPFYVEEI